MLSEQVVKYQRTNVLTDNSDIAEKFGVRHRFQEDDGESQEEVLHAPQKKKRSKSDSFVDAESGDISQEAN
jgi:hypothetical protein